MTYKEEIQRQYEILDQYDFTPYLEIYTDLDQLMHVFEYECSIENLPEDFENCVFNYCSTEDFIEYLRQRYPKYEIYEVTKYEVKKIKALG